MWKHFGFPVLHDGATDKKRTICKLCKSFCAYSGNTSTMQSHLQKHHWSVMQKEGSSDKPEEGATKQLPGQLGASSHCKQASLVAMFKSREALCNKSSRAQAITRGIAEFLILDMKPLSLVEGKGFKNLMNVLEPRYTVPSRKHVLEKHILPLYHKAVEDVKCEISKGVRHAITTDGWQSLSTKSFVTYTCHYIEPGTFTLQAKVLNTLHTPGSHTAEVLSQEMLKISEKWALKNTVAVTDNARNVLNACDLANFPHIGCSAHTLNLAVNKCLSVPEVETLVAKNRKLVSVFKHSALKSHALLQAEQQLEIQVEKFSHLFETISLELTNY